MARAQHHTGPIEVRATFDDERVASEAINALRVAHAWEVYAAADGPVGIAVTGRQLIGASAGATSGAVVVGVLGAIIGLILRAAAGAVSWTAFAVIVAVSAIAGSVAGGVLGGYGGNAPDLGDEMAHAHRHVIVHVAVSTESEAVRAREILTYLGGRTAL